MRKQQKWKLIAIILCMLAAGVCYSCSEQEGYSTVLEEESMTSASIEDDNIEETTEYEEVILVHICGEVVNPGVYRVTKGSRVYEAIEAAGGFTEGAAREYLNMANAVSDGEKLVVPNLEQVKEPFGELTVSLESGGLINLNTATAEQLMTLPGVGASKASDIIQYREEQGGFKNIQDIMNVSGIKQAAFNKMKDKITVS